MTDVSVIVCCYNGAAFVSRALDSLYGQTLPQDRYEVVFVDDGSTDGTEEQVAPFRGHANFRYLANETNRGLVSSCNRGLREAAGPYVIRLDADDLFAPSILEEMLAPISRGTTDFVYCDRIEELFEEGRRRYVSLAEFNPFDLIAIGTMMRRDLMLEVGGYREVFWEEYDLYLRYLQTSDKPPYHIAKPLLTYSIRAGSLCADGDKARAGWREFRRLWPAAKLGRFAGAFDARLSGWSGGRTTGEWAAAPSRREGSQSRP